MQNEYKNGEKDYTRTKFSYNEKINAIHEYFGVSIDAAKYMFNRRKCGHPWKKSNDKNYLKWCIQLQNAFIEADNIRYFDWDALTFSNDINILSDNGIEIDNQLKIITKNNKTSIKKKPDEWTIITSDQKKINKKHLLKFIGFLPIVSRE